MAYDRTREIEVLWHGYKLVLMLRDDGYRIYAKVVSGGTGNLPNGTEVLWAEYKQCDFTSIGFAVADILMTPNGPLNRRAEDCPFCELESLRAAVQKVKAHLRDTDAGVLRLGLRDNDESRAALHALFELTPNAALTGERTEGL